MPCSFLQLVRGVEPAADLRHDPQDGALRQGHAALLQDALHRRKRVAVDVLHHEVGRLVLLADVEDLRDVRVLDARGDAGLVEEHLLEVRVRGVLRAGSS